MAVHDVRCREVVELMTDFLEGRLAVDRRDLVERHIAMCTWCQTYLDQMCHTVSVVGYLRDRIAALDAAVDRDGVLFGDHVHPALVERRLQRVTLGRLLAVLRLPDKEDHRPQRRGGFRRAYQLRQVIGDGA